MTITPSSEEKIIVLQHRSPENLLAFAYPTLRHHERTANIVLAPALARAPAEYVLTHCQFIADADILLPFPSAQPSPSTNFWITVWSQHANCRPALDMVLSCLKSSLGDYPVFLWTPAEQGLQHPQWLGRRITEAASYLRACVVGPERVFSVFGTSNLATTFAHAWAGLTGFPVNPKPLYNAYFAVCTPQTLKHFVSGNACVVRRAIMRDIEATARLCQEFANSSEYPLSIDEATAEARELIEKGLLWVGTMDGEIATICAVTRNSLHVSAITKVYTLQAKRRNGLAQALVQEVTQRLFECGKHSVVLYVGCNNSGRRVYERVGFMIQEGDVCLELGFDGTNAGHW
ncbi:acyl-CoA N-acyltransferase [Mycena vitilis]|nr:acyl-CoA N-acyltransferase [Mycena vitilis]